MDGRNQASTPRSAEMTPGPGFRIRFEIERPDPEVIAGLGEFETTDISDLLNRLYTVNSGIQNLTAPDVRLAGPVCTVKVFPGDNLMVHKCLDVAMAGDVIAVDAGSSASNAVLGDLISTKARHRGIAGFVVDGLVRDLPALCRLDGFPVFARGHTPMGPLHRGPGEINHPVCIGGVAVVPGDVIVGDANGVVIVPALAAAEVLAALRSRSAASRAYAQAVAKGDFSNAWVDATLAAGALELPDRPPRRDG